ncbi:PREDICTED: monocarboxylate transporter 1 isoform X2 [Nicrophorus vespilloides]|uniref:Monocarboxylate transporter 1 isoform X2 n=1 Tax=Nicrophorus vespilloides TaxID=110193 RepID=A0ABM1MFX3_NICVS|nr:PREDICTED: monocarboxylate transporter 1 isoform X2 [Nicrophorus vespilloides]
MIMIDKRGRKYELVPPEGGWGYMVALGISLYLSVTIVPICVFGIVFGTFLSKIGDETYGITLVNGIFNTVLSFTGLLANHLLQKYSCRSVGLLGAVLFFVGAFSTVFIQNLNQLILTFGVFQGLGFGLLLPSGFTSFNGYFDKRQNVMMGVNQALVVAISIAWPGITQKLMDAYGWRGTQLIFAGLSLHAVLAMLALQPVKRHMKKQYITSIEAQEEGENGEPKITDGEKPLLGNVKASIVANELERRKASVISIGSLGISVSQVDTSRIEGKPKGLWTTIYDALDLSLFKDPVYVNIAFGLALSLTADIAFLSIFPMILKNANYSPADITIILTVYFSSDLACRVGLSVLSAIISVKNRYVVLAGALLSAFFRTVLIMNDDNFYIVLITCGALGFLRCMVQTPIPLVVAEQYGPRFPTAFTLYMVVGGVVACIFGPLIGFVKEVTQSDKMAVHLLTGAYLLCGIPWTIELLLKRLSKKNIVNN